MCFITLIIYFLIAIQFTTGQGSHNLLRCGFQEGLEIVCCPRPNISKIQQNSVNRSTIADTECERIVNSYSTPDNIRIINGKIAEPGEFPHMVALAYGGKPKYLFLCGGSLITERHIITAAHCISNSLTPIFARVGVLNISDTNMNPDSDYIIENMVVHPNFSNPRQYHDLAVIRLQTPVVTSNFVHPVCLYTNEKDPAVSLQVTGWGKVNASQAKSDVLLKAKQTIVPWYQCSLSYKKSRRIPAGIIDGQICALDTTGTTDSCQGDSGGPLQGYTHLDGFYRLIGVTSMGISCASSVPGVYTRISKYLDWIESVVWPSN